MADVNGNRVTTLTTNAATETDLSTNNWLESTDCPVAHLDAGNDLEVRAYELGLLKPGDPIVRNEGLIAALRRFGIIGG